MAGLPKMLLNGSPNKFASKETPEPSTPTQSPTTPPMRGIKRPNTPPAPAHGALLEEYLPYPSMSPKRKAESSFASSAANDTDPSSFTTTTSTPRRAAGKRARHDHLASPPCSPLRSVDRTTPPAPITPRRAANDTNKSAGETHLRADAEHLSRHASLLAGLGCDAANMFPTPSKTPLKKRSKQSGWGSQPENPNDAMPKPRKIKTGILRLQSDEGDFDLYDAAGDANTTTGGKIDIFTDISAREPEVDNSDANPFLTASRPGAVATRRSTRSQKSEAQLIEEAEIEEAVARGEGMVFTFRGKKVFRPYDGASAQGVEQSLEQRNLRRAAGVTTERPFTRSQLQPRRLFASATSGPNDDELAADQQRQNADIDTEADTDIEIEQIVPSAQVSPAERNTHKTPVKPRAHLETPPATVTRSSRRLNHQLAAVSEDDAAEAGRLTDDSETSPVRTKPRRPNAFDSWQRTKSRTATGAAKRGADLSEAGSSGSFEKRTRASERRLDAVTP